MNQIPILMYHSIGEHADRRFERFVVMPTDFRRHVEYLAANQYQTMTVSSLVAAWQSGTSLPEKSVVLTFDDGFADFYTEAAPVLLECGFTATLYVATGYVGRTSGWLTTSGEGDRPMITWQELQEVNALGFEIGAHTHSHPELDRTDANTAASEIGRSKESLEDHLSVSIDTFAYPFGYWSKRVRAVVADAGFQTAVQVGELTTRQEDDVLSIPRLSVNGGTTSADLAALLTARASGVSRALSTSKRRVWQTLRRCGADSFGKPR